MDGGPPGPHHGAVTADADPAIRTHRRRRAWWAAALVLLVAVLALEARSALWFHTVLPWAVGERVHVCGRDFQRAGHVSAATVGGPLARIADGPLFQPLYGHPAGSPCTMTLYLPEGDGYREYGLVGGP
jgi:hypothetical protein